ncbi:MAG: XdhC/CoxI family protein [Candidatus Neomarinimicrobiota bacterium]|nr:MAG: XdhC/CoxI family protein [Candidatus Neomarinimicrobiota bacterium]
MIEKAVLDALVNLPSDQAAVVCSLVRWKGSVPRKDYPVMIVLPDRSVGTIGGGQMEYDVIRAAREVLHTAQPQLRSFDLTNRDALAEGSLCGGTTEIVLEPLTDSGRREWQNLQAAWESEGWLWRTEVQRRPVSVRRQLLSAEEQSADLPTANRPLLREEPERLVLVEVLQSPPRFHLFGAGHVGRAVADLAAFIGLPAVVYDDREDLLTEERFPRARRVRLRYDRPLEDQVRIRNQDLILIATPGHTHDLALLRWTLRQAVSYVGLISSRRKWSILKAQLIREGYAPETVNRVHSPVGLDVQAETVPEIAVSIVAEVILHLRGKPDRRE